jgi:hypothetical protein
VGVPGFDRARSDAIESTLYIVAETGLDELQASQRIAFIEACERPTELEDDGHIRLSELGGYLHWLSRQTER